MRNVNTSGSRDDRPSWRHDAPATANDDACRHTKPNRERISAIV
jgi:hypothetical protein